MDTEVQRAKTELSRAIAYKVETGDSFNFYGEEMAETLAYYMNIRASPLSRGIGGPPQDKIPSDHPKSLSEIRRTDFGDDDLNFWRDRMVRHFNKI